MKIFKYKLHGGSNEIDAHRGAHWISVAQDVFDSSEVVAYAMVTPSAAENRHVLYVATTGEELPAYLTPERMPDGGMRRKRLLGTVALKESQEVVHVFVIEQG